MEDYERERARGTWPDRLVKEGFRGKGGWLAELHLVPVGAGFKHRCPAVGARMSLECGPACGGGEMCGVTAQGPTFGVAFQPGLMLWCHRQESIRDF